MEQWENNYYISAIAGATNGSSLVVMSKGLLSFFCHRMVIIYWQIKKHQWLFVIYI
jgi:hypothetical protein